MHKVLLSILNVSYYECSNAEDRFSTDMCFVTGKYLGLKKEKEILKISVSFSMISEELRFI